MGTEKDPRMREALRLARTGEKEQARRLLNEIIRQDRENFDAWTVMAQVTEDRKEAISSIKQALRLRPGDERAQRYLDYLLQDEQSLGAPGKPHRLLAGLVAIVIIVLIVSLILFLLRPGSQAPTGQPGSIAGAQPIANQPIANQPFDCAALINDALEISDRGCEQVGRNEVCYGHNTVQAQLVPGSDARFDQPGSIIPVNFLESFAASPFDQQKGEWGVGVFRLEANLPGTLPGQLVTMLVFGNTTIQNTSGDMQAFYFTSRLGGITCDAVPFDGILIRMAEGAGFAFKANGTDITLQGNSILQATANESLVVTALSGVGTVRALEQEQSLASGQTVTVPMGGPSGLDAGGPPNPPQTADDSVLDADCALSGTGCPVEPTTDPQTMLGPDGASTVTNSPLGETDDKKTPVDKPTPTREPKTTKEPKPTDEPKPTKEPKPTDELKPTKEPKPTDAPKPTDEPKPTKEPKPTDAPKPTDEPKPTKEPKPTDVPKPTDEPKPTKEPKPDNTP